jgi:DNA invertase Pin-like site-specific DNA recombinase
MAIVMAASAIKAIRCAIYTRKSTEHGLELEFNSLDAQRDSCEAYIKSQASQGWRALPQHYDDPAFSGGNLDRPALQQLLRDIDAGRIDVIVVYKIDRLTRSLADFAKLVEAFDAKSISFVAVTQQFNTTTSMGRLTLNVLLSFAQFERELSSERVRDRSRLADARANGPVAPCPLVMTPKTRSSSSTGPRPRLSGISSSGILRCRVSENWWTISTPKVSSPSGGTPRSKNTTVRSPSPTVPSLTS